MTRTHFVFVVAGGMAFGTARAASAQDALPPLPPPAPSPSSAPAPAPESAPAPAVEAAPAYAPATAPGVEAAPPPEAPFSDGCPGATRVHCHDGFYFRVAAGVGATSFSGDGPNGSSASIRGGSAPFRLAFGGTVANGLVLGGALYGAGTPFGANSSGLGDAKAEFGALAFFVDWFPDPSGGWHVGGDLGLGFIGVSNGGESQAGGNLVTSVYGGYDWWFASDWSFGPLLALTGGSHATLRDSSSNNDTGYSLGVGSISILASFLYH